MNQTEAQRDRLQAILDAERGIKGPARVGLRSWDGGWYVPAGRDRHHAMVYARKGRVRRSSSRRQRRQHQALHLQGRARRDGAATAMLKTMGPLA